MTKCAIKLCRNYRGRKKTANTITYHMIPIDPIIRHKWIEIIRRSHGDDIWKPSKRTVVCSEHFRRKHIILKNQRKKLSNEAVPCKALYLASAEISDDDDNGDNRDNIAGNTESVIYIVSSGISHGDDNNKNNIVGNAKNVTLTSAEIGHNDDNIVEDAKNVIYFKSEKISDDDDDGDNDNFTGKPEDVIHLKSEKISDDDDGDKDNFAGKSEDVINIKSEKISADDDMDNFVESSEDVDPNNYQRSSLRNETAPDDQNRTQHHSMTDLSCASTTVQAATANIEDDDPFDTPVKWKLRRELRRRISLQKIHTLKIQSLRRKNLRLQKKIASLKNIISKLRKK